MLVNELQAKGLTLSIYGDKLVFESDAPITEEQLGFLKKNKLNLMEELRDLVLVEIDENGDIFPLHRFKAKQMPAPKTNDLAWLHEMLNGIPNRLAAAAEYSRIYKQAYDEEPAQHRKDNSARWKANIWLREKTKPMRYD